MPVRVIDRITPFGNFPVVNVEDVGQAFVKSIVRHATTGVYTVTYQDSANAEQTHTFRAGWTVSATEPASPHNGQGWWDTANDALKIYDGTTFVETGGGADLTLDQLHALAQIPGLVDKTVDIRIEETRVWETATDAGFITDTGTPSNSTLESSSYETTYTYTSSNVNRNRIFIAILAAEDIRNYRIELNPTNGDNVDTDGSQFKRIHETATHHYYHYRIHAAAGVLTLQKDVLTGSSTHFRGKTDADQTIVDATDFVGVLDTTDTDVQAALDQLDTIFERDLTDEYTIAQNHVTRDTGERWHGNIYEVKRDFGLEQFTQVVRPDAAGTYVGYVAKLTRNSATNYTKAEAFTAADATDNAAAVIDTTLEFNYGTPFDLVTGDYVWVGVYSDTNALAYSRQRPNAVDSERIDTLDFIDYSRFDGTAEPDNTFNLHSPSGTGSAYAQTIRETHTDYEELIVEKDGVTVYTGSNKVNYTGAAGVSAGTGKAVINIPEPIPANVVQHSGSLPDVSTISGDDLKRLHAVYASDDTLTSVSYVEDASEHQFHMKTASAAFSYDSRNVVGWSVDDDEGLFESIENLSLIASSEGANRTFDVLFTSSTVPNDYTSHTHLAIYYRVWGSGDDFIHKELAKQSAPDETLYQSATGLSDYFVADTEYEIYLRWGQHGNGTTANVPAGNRLVSFEDGARWRALQNVDIFGGTNEVTQVIQAVATNYKGVYEAARAYVTWDVISDNNHFWLAPTAIVAGEGAPTRADHKDWWLLAKKSSFRGNLSTANTYDLTDNDWYRVGSRVFMATATQAAVTGNALLSGTNIVELTAGVSDADEVTVDASSFAGLLSGTDIDVQTALDTIDGLDLDGSELPRFRATLAVQTSVTSITNTFTNVLDVATADILENTGSFTVSATGDSIEIPEDGTYLVLANIRFEETSTSTSRVLMTTRVRLESGGVATADSDLVLGCSYIRNGSGILSNFVSGSVVVAADDGDILTIEAAENAAVVNSFTIAGSESSIHIIKLPDSTGGSAGSGGQNSPSTQQESGPTYYQFYQAVAEGTIPSDPAFVVNADGTINTDFSPWADDISTVGAGGILWTSSGGTYVDDVDGLSNRTWFTQPVLTEEYAIVPEDSNTHTFTSTDPGLRYRRVWTRTGPGPWVPIYNGTGGWISLVTETPTFAAIQSNQLLVSIPEFDAEYFRELEIDLYTAGAIDAQNAGTDLGGRAQTTYRRLAGNWTVNTNSGSVAPIDLGSFKVRYNDEAAVDMLAAQSRSLDDEFVNGISGSPGDPARRLSFSFHLIGKSTTEPNVITHVRVGPFTGSNHFAFMSIRMR